MPESETSKTHHLLAIHGLGGRGAWFNRLAERLEPEIKLHSFDLTGFGMNNSNYNARKDLPSGQVDTYKQWFEDILEQYQEIKSKDPGAKVTVMGHSMGAVLLTNLADKIDPNDQLILSVPGYKGHPDTFSAAYTVQVLCRLFFDTFLFHKQNYIDLPSSKKESGMDPTATDPYKVTKVSPNLLWQVLKNTELAPKSVANIRQRLLMLQIQGDLVVDNATQDELFDEIASVNKELKAYPYNNHDWIWFDEVETIAADLKEWICTQ